MSYVYAGLFFAVALLMFFRLGRENKVFYLAGALFLFMGAWWLFDALLDVDLFHGVWGWVFRGVMALALIFFVWVYWRERKKATQEKDDE